MSGFAPPPTPTQVPHEPGCAVRIHVKAAGVYCTNRTTLDHAREIHLRFMTDLVAALHPDQVLPLVPFPASGAVVDLMVRADQVAAVEVVRVDQFGRTR